MCPVSPHKAATRGDRKAARVARTCMHQTHAQHCHSQSAAAHMRVDQAHRHSSKASKSCVHCIVGQHLAVDAIARNGRDGANLVPAHCTVDRLAKEVVLCGATRMAAKHRRLAIATRGLVLFGTGAERCITCIFED